MRVPPLVIIWIVILVALVLLALEVEYVRCRRLILNWASERGYRVHRIQRAFLRRPPISRLKRGNRSYFLLAASRADGKVRHGWALCGGRRISLLSGEVEVLWEY